MKRILPLVFTLAGFVLAGTGVSAAAPKENKPLNVEVVFEQPEKYTDVKDGSMSTDRGRDAILDELRDFIQTESGAVLPAEQKFKITFTDIDLAGDYEPWRMPPAGDIRIVKDIYAPRFEFSWQVSDRAGAVLKQGKENLRDMAFMSRITISRNDPLRYEKDMLRDWLRSTLRVKSK